MRRILALRQPTEQGAAEWAAEHGGSVVELHAYACDPTTITDPDAAASVVDRLIADMQSVDGWRTEFLPWGSGLMLCVRD